MIKKCKSSVALSLGLALCCQNTVISHASQTANNSSTTTTVTARSSSNPNAIGSGKVNLNTLTVRSGPSTSYSQLGYLKYNDTVEILGTSSNWYRINFNGKTGYVLASHIKLNILEKGIDVSNWNGNINWYSVKNAGIDYVIIKVGSGITPKDNRFTTYIQGATNAGLKVGVYWFSYANSVTEAKIEAQKCLQAIAPYKSKITYPVFFDFEYDSVNHVKKVHGITMTKNLATQIATTFLNTVKASGYKTGIYTNKNFSNTYFSTDLLDSNNLWVSNYSSVNSFGRPYAMWQYSESGRIPGISTTVDLNYTTLKMTNSYTSSNTSTSSANTVTSSSQTGVTTGALNFRNSASSYSTILATIPNNTSVEIINKLSSGWYQVKYKNTIGYVSGSYIKLNSSSSTNTTTTTTSAKGVVTNDLNFRKSSSTSSSIICKIPRNTTIDVLKKLSTGWYQVKYKGFTGYVSGIYVKMK